MGTFGFPLHIFTSFKRMRLFSHDLLQARSDAPTRHGARRGRPSVLSLQAERASTAAGRWRRRRSTGSCGH